MYVDVIKLAGKKQNIDPMWKILMKDVDLGEPTDVVDNERNMFECRIYRLFLVSEFQKVTHLPDTVGKNIAPNTGYEPKFCTDVSSDQTPINFPYKKEQLQPGG